MPALQREAAWAEERFLGDLQQSVPKTAASIYTFLTFLSQKNPRVREISVRNSVAGNGCVNFMDAWKKCVLSSGKAHVHKFPRFRGGGGILGFGGGGSADFIFMGARTFLIIVGAHGSLRKAQFYRSWPDLMNTCQKHLILWTYTMQNEE